MSERMSRKKPEESETFISPNELTRAELKEKLKKAIEGIKNAES